MNVFFYWQIEQPAMKWETKIERPGHQKSCSRLAFIQNWLKWLVMGRNESNGGEKIEKQAEHIYNFFKTNGHYQESN